jgi:hypothetical protein
VYLISGKHCPGAVFGARKGRKGNGGCLAPLLNWQLSQATDEFVPVHFRHPDVTDDNVRLKIRNHRKRLFGARGSRDVGVALGENPLQESTGVGFVVEHKNFDVPQ